MRATAPPMSALSTRVSIWTSRPVARFKPFVSAVTLSADSATAGILGLDHLLVIHHSLIECLRKVRQDTETIALGEQQSSLTTTGCNAPARVINCSTTPRLRSAGIAGLVSARTAVRCRRRAARSRSDPGVSAADPYPRPARYRTAHGHTGRRRLDSSPGLPATAGVVRSRLNQARLRPRPICGRIGSAECWIIIDEDMKTSGCALEAREVRRPSWRRSQGPLVDKRHDTKHQFIPFKGLYCQGLGSKNDAGTLNPA